MHDYTLHALSPGADAEDASYTPTETLPVARYGPYPGHGGAERGTEYPPRSLLIASTPLKAGAVCRALHGRCSGISTGGVLLRALPQRGVLTLRRQAGDDLEGIHP